MAAFMIRSHQRSHEIETRHSPEPTERPTRDAADLRSLRILLAEDDEQMRLLLAWSLKSEGFEVIHCEDGMELLDALSRTIADGEADRLALIISDIRMPGISGLDLLRGLRHSEAFPPMILITAFGDEETHAEAERLGAAAMFDKPFEIRHLVARVHEILDDPHGKKSQ
jgi:DNA-binding response OmpR family regulator